MTKVIQGPVYAKEHRVTGKVWQVNKKEVEPEEVKVDYRGVLKPYASPWDITEGHCSCLRVENHLSFSL